MTNATEEIVYTRCRTCGSPLDSDNPTAPCKPCVNARAQRWYSENTTRANAQSTVVQKAKRRYGPAGLDEIRSRLGVVQGGLCACCDQEPATGRMGIDWSLDQTTDAGDPLLRALVCKPCKIAINRYIHPSRFVLQPERIEQIKAYLRRPWQDPKHLLQGWKGNQPLTPLSRTEGLVAWLDSGMRQSL